jgi:hypothetical protein
MIKTPIVIAATAAVGFSDRRWTIGLELELDTLQRLTSF